MLRKLYLKDLGKQITYDGVKFRQRVRHMELWEGVKSTSMNGCRVLTPDDNIWVWSDQHFGHKNIIKFCNRPWESIDQMSADMVKSFNTLVGPSDVSIWVGDVGFKSDEDVNNLLDQCQGYKILVVGNHDFTKRKLRTLHFDEIHLLYQLTIDDIGYVFTHYPQENLPLPYINIHGHTHQKVLDSDQHINVCVERTEYKPVNMNDLHSIGKTRVESLV